MKAELAKREPAMLAAWEQQSLYQKIQSARQNAPKFILHDGPPYANGDIHVGHAVNKILKDIVVKAKVLSGFQAPYIPGWDCHGLPIELQVEKKIGKVGPKVSASEFRTQCRNYAAAQIQQQRQDFKRLGIIGDWEHPYATMDNSYEANIVRTIAKIYKNGHIKKGYKPIHWCLDCSSSLAEAEVEYKDKESDSITVKFAVLNPAHPHTYLLVWTTTPWTLPANQAVAAGADIDYVLVACENKNYWVAEVLCPQVFKDLEHKIIQRQKGKDLAGTLLQHPFYDKQVPLILGDHVTTDAGTGFVHTAPAHGVDDFIVGQKYQLDLLNPVGSNGCFTAETLLFAGIHVNKANPVIIETLLQKDNLFKHEKINHSYPHCWRHKTPLIFRATPQWFISMEHLLKKATKAAQEVIFIPAEGQTRFMSMLIDRPDWCISRQRYWGTPLPLFINKNTGELHKDTERLIEEVAQRIEQQGLDAWFNASPEDYGIASSEYDKTTDTIDVWLDSGASNQCILKNQQQFPDLKFPADLYLEGSDQHRAWFQSSLLTAIAAGDNAPYRQILTHGFVVDGEGRKMSKSIGNIITPQEVMNQYGADILRLWVAMSDYRGELSISPTILQQAADLYRKFRNTLRYMLAALNDFSTEHLISFEQLAWLDKIMVAKAAEVQEFTKAIFANHSYNIRGSITKLFEFCEKDLSNIYFDILKDRLYTENAHNRHVAQSALYYILQIMVRVLSPVLSFTSDEAWQIMRSKNLCDTDDATVFTLEWYDLKTNTHQKFLEQPNMLLKTLAELRANINKELDSKRKNGEIGSSLDIELSLTEPVNTDQAQIDDLSAFKNELKYFFLVSKLTCIDAANTAPIIKKSTEPKCERCWHHGADVSQKDDDYQDQKICNRCNHNLKNTGEHRKYF
jgi:isoleucyl-tRNA synthetase